MLLRNVKINYSKVEIHTIKSSLFAAFDLSLASSHSHRKTRQANKYSGQRKEVINNKNIIIINTQTENFLFRQIFRSRRKQNVSLVVQFPIRTSAPMRMKILFKMTAYIAYQLADMTRLTTLVSFFISHKNNIYERATCCCRIECKFSTE